ncbi:ammonium transporter [Sphingoaurantiacus capsulatus]|uniref:Ammonium transporter n=1 Tax=Sphingoaurantiacus capsulatus TaxID=1771310 RepID=A0ABV7X8Z7_9SPHN
MISSNKLLRWGGLAAGLTLVAAPALAQEVVTTVVETVAAAPAADPVPDKGDTAWMMVSTVLVLAMIVPGLALFYGGLVRTKNMLSVLTQVLAITAVACLVWVFYGYSLAFTDGPVNAFLGGTSRLFLSGVTPDSTAATFSDGVVIPEYVFIAFQMTFAAITTALIVGSLAERIKFSALLVFSVLWITIVYLPIAHMVWWAGGYIFEMGALDFAGGTVVHINAGVAGLVGALILGKRLGYQKEILAPHSLTMTLIGTGLLWVGWFGFNAGSNLEATGGAALAMINTFVATAAAALAWLFAEWATRGKPSLLGAASGVIAGLVAITPAAGIAGPMGAIVLGAVASVICYWFVGYIKPKTGLDDSLDVFGIHGIGGIIGSIGTGIVVSPALGGIGLDDYSMAGQVTTQAIAVAIAILWSGIGSAVLFFIIKAVMGLRVPEEKEREGLDLAEHGERAYHY